MNEFSAKRLGEILAFVDALLYTCDKGKGALTSILGEEHLLEIVRISRSHKDSVHTISDRAKVLHSVMNKLEIKGDELNKLKDINIENDWENSTKVLQWLGYLEGMTILHASAFVGISVEIGHAELRSFADSYNTYHKELFNYITNLFHDISRDKARG